MLLQLSVSVSSDAGCTLATSCAVQRAWRAGAAQRAASRLHTEDSLHGRYCEKDNMGHGIQNELCWRSAAAVAALQRKRCRRCPSLTLRRAHCAAAGPPARTQGDLSVTAASCRLQIADSSTASERGITRA